MLFLLVLILLFGLMIWLTLYPLGFPKSLLKLQHIEDFHFKLLLLGIAALNFFAAFVLEVGQGGFGMRHPPGASPGGHGALLSSPNPVSLPSLAPDCPGSRLTRLLPKAAPEKSLQEAFQEAGEGAEPAAASLATPGRAPVRHTQDVPGREIALPAVPSAPALGRFLNLFIAEKAGIQWAGSLDIADVNPMVRVIPWPH